jgi:hypothetical protein
VAVVEELDAMRKISEALDTLQDEAARVRVLRWAVDAYANTRALPPRAGGVESSFVEEFAGSVSRDYATAGELVEAADPATTADRVLAVAYWLHSVKGEQDFTSQAVNDELKNMGHGVKNITDALTKLIARKPALARQTRKSGTAKQARKRYALTDAGRKRIEVLLAEARRADEEE